MKKVIVAFVLLFLATEISFPVEAGLKSRITDFVKRRKNDDDSKSVEKIASALKGIGSNFASSGSNQFRYVSGKFLNTEDDLSFLIAYSSFARNCEMFFSLLEILLSKIRTEYASLLGDKNRLEKASKENAIKKLEASISKYKSNINRCLEIIDSEGIDAINANLQCSSIILLKIIQSEEEVSAANQATIKKQIETFIDKYSAAFESISSDLSLNISTIQSASDFEIDVSPKIDTIVNNVNLVHNVLKTLNRYISGREISEQEIDSYLSDSKYYRQTSNRKNNYNKDDEEEEETEEEEEDE